MRAIVAAGALAALILVSARETSAQETPDAGQDAARDGAGDQARREARPAAPAPVPAPAPPAAPIRAAPAAPVDPWHDARVAAESAAAAWPLTRVDRPQTMFKGMEAVSVTGRSYFGPASYGRRVGAVSYAKAVTNRIELAVTLPWVVCGGEGRGECSPSLAPDVTVRAALVQRPKTRLALGASIINFTYAAETWASLELVLPRRFRVAIEPLVSIAIAQRQTYAWWNGSVVQDSNQSRAFVSLDGTLQLTQRFDVWAAAEPYLPLDSLGAPGELAVQAAAGASVAVSKGFDVGAWCRDFNVLPARRWEYIPGVQMCAIGLSWRRFGFPPVSPISVGPVPLDFY